MSHDVQKAIDGVQQLVLSLRDALSSAAQELTGEQGPFRVDADIGANAAGAPLALIACELSTERKDGSLAVFGRCAVNMADYVLEGIDQQQDYVEIVSTIFASYSVSAMLRAAHTITAASSDPASLPVQLARDGETFMWEFARVVFDAIPDRSSMDALRAARVRSTLA